MCRAREADRKHEAELRIQARQERRIKEKIQEANTQVPAIIDSLSWTTRLAINCDLGAGRR